MLTDAEELGFEEVIESMVAVMNDGMIVSIELQRKNHQIRHCQHH